MRALAGLLFVVLLVGCDDKPPAGHVVVYAHDGARAQRIEEMLAEFTAETGVLVTPRFGASTALTDAVIGKGDMPRADVLVTAGAADIWRAANEGALRPLPDETLQLVPPPLRDPDGYWIATSGRTPFVLVAENAPAKGVNELGDLGGPEFQGRLCLSSSHLPGNRALIAALIEAGDNKSAERIVRRWVRNLALPPFATDAELVDAIRAGRCEIGITAAGERVEPSLRFWPESGPRPLSIDGIGVARHAANPEAAQRLVAWIARKQGPLANRHVEYVHAGIAGRRDDEARLLAERAGYR